MLYSLSLSQHGNMLYTWCLLYTWCFHVVQPLAVSTREHAFNWAGYRDDNEGAPSRKVCRADTARKTSVPVRQDKRDGLQRLPHAYTKPLQ